MNLALQYQRPILAYGVKEERLRQLPGERPLGKTLLELEDFRVEKRAKGGRTL